MNWLPRRPAPGRLSPRPTRGPRGPRERLALFALTLLIRSRRGAMRRSGLVLAVCLFVSPALRAQAPAELAQTAAFVAAHQNPDGGFAATKGGTSSLGATSSAIRSLKYTAGSIPDVPACIAYVQKCRDA